MTSVFNLKWWKFQHLRKKTKKLWKKIVDSRFMKTCDEYVISCEIIAHKKFKWYFKKRIWSHCEEVGVYLKKCLRTSDDELNQDKTWFMDSKTLVEDLKSEQSIPLFRSASHLYSAASPESVSTSKYTVEPGFNELQI